MRRFALCGSGCQLQQHITRLPSVGSTSTGSEMDGELNSGRGIKLPTIVCTCPLDSHLRGLNGRKPAFSKAASPETSYFGDLGFTEALIHYLCFERRQVPARDNRLFGGVYFAAMQNAHSLEKIDFLVVQGSPRADTLLRAKEAHPHRSESL